MTYYHIQRLDAGIKKWTTEEKICTPTDEDNFFQRINLGTNRSKSTDKRYDGKRLFDHAYPIIKSRTPKNILKSNLDCEEKITHLNEMALEYRELSMELAKSSFHYYMWIREEIFEQTRKANFNELPSRKRCLWVCAEGELEAWWPKIGKAQKQIVRLETIGKFKVHKADEKHLLATNFNIDEIVKNSNHYWEGTLDRNSIIETLVEGEFVVKECYPDLKTWKKSIT